MPLPNSLVVHKTQGRRFAISDIHGCAKTFKAILTQIQLSKNDQLFLVGDMVNRGPKSNRVLDRIIRLKKEGFQVFYIRGNHEQLLLNTIRKSLGQRKRVFKSYNSLNLLEGSNIKKEYLDLLNSSYHFIETEDYWLVHAGFNHKAMNPFEDTYSMLNTRKYKSKKKYLKGKTSIVGHTPIDISTIVRRIKCGKRKIYIDNGCANHKTKQQGNLLCYDMDTKTLIVQLNLDIK